MPANTAISVTGLSFDTIRANLRDFIKAKSEFADFDYEDSAIGSMLDLLAYNTYYNAFYANMATNESFLDSAQLYDSVVSHAKTLGYRPVSAVGATANVRISFTDTATLAQRSLNIVKNSQFTATINGVSYIFVTPKSYTISANSTNGFRGNIDIIEGVPLTHRFLFNTANTSFILPNENVDISSITITATVGSNTQAFIRADDIFTVNSSSKVYFLDADKQNLYKVSFGDNVFGIKPDTNSTVTINYRVCNGQKGNGANNFTGPGSLGGKASYSIAINERASGGAAQESIESVRFNAPRAYQVQNRAVSKNDYSSIILNLNPDLSAVSSWGGEENDPPIYGKVYVAVKPAVGTLISTNRKASIAETLKEYNVQSIETVIVDAAYLYVVPAITVRYNSNETELSGSGIGALVAQKIIQYEASNLNLFNKKFRFSRFLDYISDADPSIVSATSTIDIQRKFAPSIILKDDYILTYNQELRRLGNTKLTGMLYDHVMTGSISSSSFTYKDQICFFDDDGYGTLRAYYLDGAVRNYINSIIGTIDYVTGVIYINSFLPSAISGDIKVNARPLYEDVTPIRNQILLIADATIRVIDDNSNKLESTISSVNTIGSTTSLSAVTSASVSLATY
jgi:hypothetical protein